MLMNKNLEIQQQIAETLETNYMPYAMSVIISRAIPEIDGFKPSHRKLLYTMYKMGLLKETRTKSANVVGQTMRLNPHGDASIYETMVRLTEGNMSLLHPLVDSKGNFGKAYSRDMSYAASRYTEVRLSDICNFIFGDIDKNTVEFMDNYDSSTKEPILLPTKFPNILVNPNQGIAVGMASNICSFNLREVCATAIAYLKNPQHDIASTLLAPDFSTGGELVLNQEEMQEIYKTGRGSFKVRAKWKYDKKNNCIDVYEIPYTTTVEAIQDKIIELCKTNKIKDISDVRDETDLKGLKLTIDLKRGVDPDKLMAKLFKATPLLDSFGCNFNVLIDGKKPMTLGIAGILDKWIEFRLACIIRQLNYDIEKKSAYLHILQGLEQILLDIDKAIKLIRNTELDSEVIPNLMKGFGIDKIQAEYVAEIKLRNLNKEYILNKTSEIEDLLDEIADLKSTLGSDTKQKNIIAKQLQEVAKKHGADRKTHIIANEEIVEVNLTDDIEDYPLKLFLTKDGFLKKISSISLRMASDHKLKERDKIIWELETSNLAELIVFTNKQNAYKIKLHELNDCKASAFGEYLPSVMQFDDEKIIGQLATKDFKGQILFAFANGKIAKVPIKSYETVSNRKKLSNAFSDKSELVQFIELPKDEDFLAFADNRKVLAFNSSQVPEKSTRSTQGIGVMTIKRGSKLLKVIRASQIELQDLSYYKTKNIPAVGCFLKKEDEQVSFKA